MGAIFEKMGVLVDKTRSFIENTTEEMRKSNWPSRDQLFESTLLVLIALVVATLYVSGIDQILFRAIKFLTTFSI